MTYPPILRIAFVVFSLLVAARNGGSGTDANGRGESPAGVSSKKSNPRGVSASDWSSIHAAYEAGRHAAVAIDGGLEARNPGQRWTTRFDGRGFVTKPDEGHWSWGLELQSYGAPGHECAISGEAAVNADGPKISYNWDSNLTEWYKNDGYGLEHGYTIHSRPANSNGVLTFTLAVCGDLRPRIQINGCDVRFVDSSNAFVLNYSGLKVTDADGTRIPAHFESIRNGLKLTVNDTGARYPLTIDPIAQQAYLKASNTDVSDQFGYAVSVSGNTVVVGAPGEDGNATGVNGNESNELSPSSGAAYVFVRNGANWSQQAYLKASNTGAFDGFGVSVSVSGDTLVVGAFSEDSSAKGVNGNQGDNSASGSGAAYVFVRVGTSWSQQAYLKASNTDANDTFGYCVAVSGDTVVVGAYSEDSKTSGVNGHAMDNSAPNAGAAYVFVRNGSAWTQQAYLKASNTDAGDSFGQSVAVSGDTIAVGATGEDSGATGVNGNESDNSASNAGATYIFIRNGATWTQQAYLKASNTGVGHFFGSSVSVSGSTVVVGAPAETSNATGVNGNQNDNSAIYAGAAYVFVYNGTTWTQQAYLKASNTQANDWLGASVAISGDTVVVGAYNEDSSSTGINGNQSDNSAFESGAAYVYIRNGATWSQQFYLKASNTGILDNFGFAASVSGDLVVIGALNEASSANGVNGNQNDNITFQSGAVYIFDLGNNPGTLSYGTGTPGCSGTESLGVTHAPMINSPNFAITCNNAPPSSLGLGLVTDSQDLIGSDPFGIGVLLHSDFIFASEVYGFDFHSDATGYAETVGTGIPNSPVLIGKTYYACAIWVWSSCTLPGFNVYNMSSSRGLAITITVP